MALSDNVSLSTGVEHAAVLPREHHGQAERQRADRHGLAGRRSFIHGRLQAGAQHPGRHRPRSAVVQLQR